ncbi:MAG TPA: hypothetical protein VHX12_08060 [Acidisoma sp.]|nr:hypothetical protein [Acidisoma sp.]
MRAYVRGLALLLGVCGASVPAWAHPSEIIILRHPEKIDQFKLCPLGRERAQALAHQYLGRHATQSVFAPGVSPAAVIAVTLHSLELAAPIADTWNLPVTTYSVLPTSSKATFEKELNAATRHAARTVMSNPAYAGKPVIMAWEHNHIARTRLEAQFAGQKVTLSQLFNLDRLPTAPRDWPSQTYDYLWIIEFANPNSDIPTGFRMIRQDFTAPYDNLPDNAWGTPEPTDDDAGCVKVGLRFTAH